MKLRLLVLLLAVAAAVALARPAVPARVVVVSFTVVVNDQNPVRELTRTEVSDLFLGKTARWPDGSEVMPVDQVDDTELRSGFSRSIHGRSVKAVRSHWRQQVFSGKGAAPPEVEGDEEVMNWVREHRGGIGYIEGTSVIRDGVKIMRIKD